MRILLISLFAMSVQLSFCQSEMEQALRNLKRSKPDSPDYLVAQIKLSRIQSESKPDSALMLARHAFGVAKREHYDSLFFCAQLAIAISHGYLANYDSSTWYSYESIKGAKRYGDTLALIDNYNNLGIVFYYLEDDEKALEYYQEVERLSRLSVDSLRLGHVLNNIGIIYSNLGKYDLELKYYNEAASIFLALGDRDGYGNTLLNTGTVYTQLEQYTKAEDYFKKALIEFESIESSSGIQNVLLSSSENKLEQGDMMNARSLAKKELKLSRDYNYPQDELYAYELLILIEQKSSNYQLALAYQTQFIERKEEIFTLEANRQINELETKYATAKKELEIERLSLENSLHEANLAKSRNAQLAIGIGSVLTIILVIVFFTLRHKRHVAEREAQDLQIEALQKRVMEIQSSSDTFINIGLDEFNQKLHNDLTEREFEILRLSLENKTNTEISEELFISVSTVKFHLRNTYAKLGVNNRKEAFEYVAKKA